MKIVDVIKKDVQTLLEQIDIETVNKNLARAEKTVKSAEELITKNAPSLDLLTKEEIRQIGNLRRAIEKWKMVLSDMSKLTVLRSKFFFPAIVERVIDADTIIFTIDQGFNDIKTKQRMRLYGINAWENKGEEAILGKKATEITKQLLPERSECLIESIASKTGKFGRWLAIVWTPIPDAVLIGVNIMAEGIPTLSVDSDKPTHFNLNEWLIENGHARKNLYVN